jgi:hypothetical protein
VRGAQLCGAAAAAVGRASAAASKSTPLVPLTPSAAEEDVVAARACMDIVASASRDDPMFRRRWTLFVPGPRRRLLVDL